MKRYDPKDIEPKWQARWDKDGTYVADLDSKKPKYIGMSMFNYPSGAGIHIGHAMNYTISDVLARFKRQQGYESYHPVGWDSFGLPAENYAIKAGVSPQASMATIIPNYHKQYKAMGWSNDWTKEIATHEPEYYKWSQWIFAEMYRAGLVYQDARMQWWCTKCQTVLANEQVVDDKCWRHEGPDDPIVEKKEVKQWFFKITDYADELLEATDDLNWTDHVKLAQKNWIGRSQGAEITFEVADSDQLLTVFTTRPDTLFGATFMVVAPEHDVVELITTDEQKAAVKKYVEQTLRKTEIQRQQEADKEKTGVFTGAYAINPVNNKKVPIWIADYVLLGYGTGAVMAVPAHDERDFEFAQKFDLPIVEVIEPEFGKAQGDETTKPSIIGVVHNTEDDTFLVLDWGPRSKDDRWGGNLFIGGGIDEGEDLEKTAVREIAEETGYSDLKFIRQTEVLAHSYFYSNVKNKNIYAPCTGLLFELKSDKQEDQNLDEGEQDKFKVRWVPRSEVENVINVGIHHYMYQRLVKQEVYSGEGLMINSGKYNGMPSSKVREVIVADLEKTVLEPTFVQTTEESAVKAGEPFVDRQAITAIVKHWKEDKYLGLKWKQVDWDTLITGGIEAGQTAETAAIAEIREETGYLNPKLVKNLGKNQAEFYHVPKKENRRAHFDCLYFELKDGKQEPIDSDEQSKHEVVWLTREQMEDFRLPASHRFVWNKLFNQGTGGTVAKSVTNYRMRDWSVTRQRYWGAPTPIIYCKKCGPVLVPDDELPVVLPELTDFKPIGDGRSALARAEDWLKVDCPQCGGPGERETDTLDTYIDSSWYMLRYFDPHNDKQAFSPERGNHWMPIDFYNGGAHATAHMLYARFVTRFFHKQGLLDNPEPFKKFLFNGLVSASDGQAFSKTLGNGPDPLDIIAQGYGADALRTYLMFAAPLELGSRWDPNGVPGTHRFLSRIWTLVQEYLAAPKEVSNKETQALLRRTTNKMTRKVTEDIEATRYNTAISALMAAVNELYKIKVDNLSQSEDWKEALETVLMCVAPFAPHISEELWRQLSHDDSIHVGHWPEWDEKYLVSDMVTVVVQVNGKVRATIEVATGSDQASVETAAKSDTKVAGYLDGQSIKKIIYIQDKILNIVI